MRVETLGRLERIELRDCWPSGASDFARWLTRKETIADLGKTLGIGLKLETQQWQAGPLSAEIICKDTGTNRWVLIENQLEWTDHGDLGKLLTSASGLEAATFVWVAARFTEEHRSTFDWLNRITDYHFRFFGLEIELWRIGTSPAAPKFTIVSKPDDWLPPLARAATAIEDPEPAENRATQRPSEWSSFAEQTAPAIEDPEPAKNRGTQRPGESFSFSELAEPTIEDPEPAENWATQRPSEWSSFAEQTAPAIEDPEPAETQKRMQRAYWTAFDKVLQTSGGPVGGGKKPSPNPGWPTASDEAISY